MNRKQSGRYTKALSLITAFAIVLTAPALVIISEVHANNPAGALRCELAAAVVNVLGCVLIGATSRAYDRKFQTLYPELVATMRDVTPGCDEHRRLFHMSQTDMKAWFRRAAFKDDVRFTLMLLVLMLAVLYGCYTMT